MLQQIYDRVLRLYRPGQRPGIIGRTVSRLFRSAIKHIGTSVIYSVDDIPLRIPPSHETPFLWRENNDYSKSLGRIAEACTRKYPQSVLIDIGANIGSSAAIIRSHGVQNTIVSVEGLQKFFDILQSNVPRLGDTIPVKAFIGASQSRSSAKARVTEGGNAHVYEEDEDYGAEKTRARPIAGAEFITVAEIAQRYVPGRQVKLIKTDIECYDIPVLNGSIDFISRHLPAIFMELHIRDIDERIKGVSWRDLWSNLKQLGYSKALYWYNSADFLCMLDLDADERITDDIHGYLRNRAGTLYVDVCIIHADDADIADAAYKVEKRHAIDLRAALGDE